MPRQQVGACVIDAPRRRQHRHHDLSRLIVINVSQQKVVFDDHTLIH